MPGATIRRAFTPGRALLLLASIALGLPLVACSEGSEPRTYEARGIVREVAPGGRQILIEHEEIPDLMPAMTMNFDLVDPDSANRLRPGQDVEFTLEYGNEGLRILNISSSGTPSPSNLLEESSRFALLAEAQERAPDFTLMDQRREAFALRELRGKAVVLDFIFTNCPGPCPLQTATHLRLRRSLGPAERDRTHFVSVSLDPARDDAEALLAYAERLSVDLDGWTFVTGTPDEVDAVLREYGVGKIASDESDIDHMLVTYLIGPGGRIAKRYLGSSQSADEMRRDIQDALASSPEPRH